MNTILFPIERIIGPYDDGDRRFIPDYVPSDCVEVIDGCEVHKMVYTESKPRPLLFGGLSAEDCTLQSQIDAGVDVKSKPVRPISPDPMTATLATMQQINNIVTSPDFRTNGD